VYLSNEQENSQKPKDSSDNLRDSGEKVSEIKKQIQTNHNQTSSDNNGVKQQPFISEIMLKL
jgi:hypothetical protein